MLKREHIEEAAQLVQLATQSGKKPSAELSYTNAAIHLSQHSGSSLDKSEGFTMLRNLLNDRILPDITMTVTSQISNNGANFVKSMNC
jgi:hypothetical protein